MRLLIQHLAPLIILGCLPGLQAHAIHQSSAEAEFNPASGKLEVSLTVFINDLELALIRHSEKLMYFDKTPADQFNEQIRSYLAMTFVVKDATGRTATIEWLGREVYADEAKDSDPAVTLFFEIPLPEDLAGCSIQHGVLCDLYADQTNLLHLRTGAKEAAWRFVRDDAAKSLRLPD